MLSIKIEDRVTSAGIRKIKVPATEPYAARAAVLTLKRHYHPGSGSKWMRLDADRNPWHRLEEAYAKRWAFK